MKYNVLRFPLSLMLHFTEMFEAIYWKLHVVIDCNS